MKNQILTLGILALSILTLGSCKKDWTCECVSTGGSYPGTTVETIRDTEKRAKKTCENGSANVGSSKTVCKIKS